jgi:hypothetical protein
MPASIIMTSFSQQMLYKISRLNIEMRKMKKPCQKIAVPPFYPIPAFVGNVN